MNKDEQKAILRNIRREIFQGPAADDDTVRAVRVRALCPCQYEWTVSLWKIVFDACQDDSPLVRAEALHVIEDAESKGFDVGRGKRIFFAALNDPAPEVRRFVADVLRFREEARKRGQPPNARKLSRTREKQRWTGAARDDLDKVRGQPP